MCSKNGKCVLEFTLCALALLVVSQILKKVFTRSPAVARLADRTGCQWPSRSFKVDDFHYIWNGVCHFLLVIDSNLGRISHRFQVIASFSSNFLLPSFRPQFENVSLALDGWNFACLSLTHMANYSCKYIRGRRTDDDNDANSLTVNICTVGWKLLPLYVIFWG